MLRAYRSSLGVYENVPGSGVWYARLRVNGKLVRKSIGTKAEAIAYVEKARRIRRTGMGILPTSARYPALTLDEMEKLGGKVTVAQLCDRYLAHIQDERNPDRPKDQVNPPIRIRAIRAKFGDRAAGSLHPTEIKDWLISLDREAATLNRYKGTFSSLYSYGREQRLLEVNPVKSLPQFEVKQPVSRYLNPDEEARLYAVLRQWIEECPAHHRAKKLSLQCHPLEIDIAIGTGLSKANQYSLRWEWVDYEHRKISIPQTKNSDALVAPMVDRVYKAFKRLEEIQAEIDSLRHGEVRVRMVSNGRVFNIRENREWWEKAIKEAGIEGLRWHDLRHATHLG